LQVDTSLNTVNAGVYNVVISGTRLTASPINYVLQDVQGSTRAVMSGTSVIARHDFQPFGEEIGAGVGMRTSAQGFGVEDKIRQRYAMTERDDSTGLDHTWWRKYENRSGRWTSADPYRGSIRITNPQSFNHYSYVQSDPLNFVDPTGLCTPLNLFLDIFVDGVRVAHIDFGTVGYTGCSGAGHRPPRGERESNHPQKPDVPKETERLFQDCLKIVEGHLTDQLANTIRDNNRSNQPLSLLIAHAAVESTLGTFLTGLGGELGLFQLKPSTARSLGLEKFTNKQLRDDFALNTRLATTYLQQQIDAFGGEVRSGLGAYKQGAKNVRENGLSPWSQIYVDAIQKCANSIKR